MNKNLIRCNDLQMYSQIPSIAGAHLIPIPTLIPAGLFSFIRIAQIPINPVVVASAPYLTHNHSVYKRLKSQVTESLWIWLVFIWCYVTRYINLMLPE